MSENASRTALTCLAMVARHHGVDLSVDRLRHDYALENEPTTLQLLRIAEETGLRARATELRWEHLLKLDKAFPLLARLDNGNWVVLAGVRVDPDGTEEVVVADPLADRQSVMFVPRDTFCAGWSGAALFVKRAWKLTDPSQPFGFAWFIPEILRHRNLFGNVAVASMMLHLLALALPVFFQLVIDKVLVHESSSTLLVLTVGVTIAIAFDSLFNLVRQYTLAHATNKIDIRVATRTFSHLLRLPIAFFERSSAGVLVKHMQQGERVRQFLTGRLFLTLLDATSLLIFVPVLYFYSPTLTLVVLAFTGLIAGIIGLLIHPYRRRLHALYDAEGKRQALLVESIHGMSTVKALALEPAQSRNWDNRAAAAVSSHFQVQKISMTAQALTSFIEKMMLVTVIGLGVNMVFESTLTVGALVAFQMLAGRVSGPLNAIVGLIHEYQEAALSMRMLAGVMNEKPERPMGVGRGIRPDLRGGIDFEGVTFSYEPGGRPAIENLSFSIKPGTVFGIIGRSGSGKTTVTRLLQGMYAPERGLIRFDGYDARELDLVHLRTNIGVVLQENFIFRGTVRENIQASTPSASFEEVIRAARLAGAEEFIERMPRGYDTLLEENGANLSGGQKQRLSIARALISDPRILILDEATASLDPDSEAIVQANLRKIAAGRTLIVISHRLSNLVDADALLLLEQGRISDIGKHNDLLSRSIIYRSLWNQQMRQTA